MRIVYMGNEVASVSRIDSSIGLFCKRALETTLYPAKETCNFLDPADCSHPIADIAVINICIHQVDIPEICIVYAWETLESNVLCIHVVDIAVIFVCTHEVVDIVVIYLLCI